MLFAEGNLALVRANLQAAGQFFEDAFNIHYKLTPRALSVASMHYKKATVDFRLRNHAAAL